MRVEGVRLDLTPNPTVPKSGRRTANNENTARNQSRTREQSKRTSSKRTSSKRTHAMVGKGEHWNVRVTIWFRKGRATFWEKDESSTGTCFFKMITNKTLQTDNKQMKEIHLLIVGAGGVGSTYCELLFESLTLYLRQKVLLSRCSKERRSVTRTLVLLALKRPP